MVRCARRAALGRRAAQPPAPRHRTVPPGACALAVRRRPSSVQCAARIRRHVIRRRVVARRSASRRDARCRKSAIDAAALSGADSNRRPIRDDRTVWIDRRRASTGSHAIAPTAPRIVTAAITAHHLAICKYASISRRPGHVTREATVMSPPYVIVRSVRRRIDVSSSRAARAANRQHAAVPTDVRFRYRRIGAMTRWRRSICRRHVTGPTRWTSMTRTSQRSLCPSLSLMLHVIRKRRWCDVYYESFRLVPSMSLVKAKYFISCMNHFSVQSRYTFYL